MVRAATRLHRHNATRQLGGERENRLATHPPAQDHRPIFADAYQAADILAQVDAQYDYCHGSLLLSSSTSILPDAQEGAGHPIKAGEDQAIGRSRGGLSTKIHALVDALGNPVGFFLTGGEAHDLEGADHLLTTMQADTLIADKAFDADARVLEPLVAVGKTAVIPPRANRSAPRDYDRELYAARHLIENFFAKIKQFRAIATRYEKTARNFLAAVHLVASVIWLN